MNCGWNAVSKTSPKYKKSGIWLQESQSNICILGNMCAWFSGTYPQLHTYSYRSEVKQKHSWMWMFRDLRSGTHLNLFAFYHSILENHRRNKKPFLTRALSVYTWAAWIISLFQIAVRVSTESAVKMRKSSSKNQKAIRSHKAPV